MCLLQRLQNVNNAAARARLGFGSARARVRLGSVRIGSDRVRSPYLWAVLTIAWPIRARQCATGSNRLAVLHAADPLSFGPIPTGAPEMVYD